jgi:protein phosphatase
MDTSGPRGLTLTSYGGSDIGRRRTVNEDAYLRDDELELWVVADGMGGHAAGDVASQESVDTIYGMVKRGKAQLAQLGPPKTEDYLRGAQRLLEGAVQAATYMVYAMSEVDLGKAGMGTTISAMMACCDALVLAQVGDSRIYQLRDGAVTQLTEDHTLVAWQVKTGLITPDQARTSKERNVITRAVGSREYVQVDITTIEPALGDVYLLCSDGLHGYLNPDELPSVIESGGDVAIQNLLALANSRGGKDNITAILVEVC